MSTTNKATALARIPDDETPLTDAEYEAARRRIHDFLGFWRACGEKRCKRGKGCRGDVAACAARLFPLIPEDAKTWLYKAFEGLRDGLSPQEANDAANKHVAAVNAVLARLAQRDADAVAAKMRTEAPPAAPSRVSETSPPRLRPPARVRLL